MAAAWRVVGDHHGRLAERVDRVAQQGEDLAAVVESRLPGRLVGEHHARARDERAGHGDALLLAAGELGRAVRQALAQADLVDELAQPRRVGLRRRA
jgi:2-keto-3-deoxy-galactonokinase